MTTAIFPSAQPGCWAGLPAGCSATFMVRSLMLRTVTGKIPVTMAELTVGPGGHPVRLHAELDVRGLDTGCRRRDRDLRLPRFLGAGQWPVMSFTAEDIRPHGDGWTAHGTLTVKDTSCPVQLGRGRSPGGPARGRRPCAAARRGPVRPPGGGGDRRTRLPHRPPHHRDPGHLASAAAGLQPAGGGSVRQEGAPGPGGGEIQGRHGQGAGSSPEGTVAEYGDTRGGFAASRLRRGDHGRWPETGPALARQAPDQGGLDEPVPRIILWVPHRHDRMPIQRAPGGGAASRRQIRGRCAISR